MDKLMKALEGKKTFLASAAKTLLGASLIYKLIDLQTFLAAYAVLDAASSAAMRAALAAK